MRKLMIGIAVALFCTATATLAELYLPKRGAMLVALMNGMVIGFTATRLAREKADV